MVYLMILDSSPLFNYDLLKSLNSNSKLQPLQQNVESIENVENVESAMHIISACPNLAKNQYQKRHDKLAKKIQWLLCKKFQLECNDKWYVSDSKLENERCKILWDFPIQTDKVIEHRRSDIVWTNKIAKVCLIIDITIGDQYIILKEQENIDKYQDLWVELGKLWKLKAEVVPVVVGALGKLCTFLTIWNST